MSLMPKLPDILGNGVRCSSTTLANHLDTNPFFFEWVFCSNLRSKDIPNQDVPPNLLDRFQSARVRLAELVQECLIVKYSTIQYKLLKCEFASIEKEYKEPLKIIEKCFQVANVYWEVVKRYLNEKSFRQSAHEVYFFKVVKPAFTCEIGFLALAYHALLFSKAVNKDLAFWERERQRKNKLLLEYPDFFTYYFNGSTENDELWLTRTTQVDYSSHDHIFLAVVMKEIAGLALKMLPGS